MTRGIKGSGPNSSSNSTMVDPNARSGDLTNIKLDVTFADLQALEELAKGQFRTASGQASYLLHQLIRQHRAGKVALVSSDEPAKLMPWETGR